MAAPGTATSPTLEDLLARFREEGRAEVLAEIFDRTAPGLFRLALHLSPDAVTAEDVLQETYLAILEHAADYEPGRPALPWLNGILRNQAGSARRRASRRPDLGRLDRAPAPDDPAAAAESAEEREALHAAMQRLPEPYRGVALLRWRYGLEPAQIADVKGVPPGTVWSWLHRALARLKVEMGALPALLLAFRPERGMDGVRRAVLRRAAAKTAATTAAGVSAASVATMGGFLMANKAIAAVAAVVILAGAGWLAFRPGDGPPPPPGPEVAKAPAPPPAPAQKPPPPAESTPSNDEPGLPDPVDLSKCDRDLDLFGVVVDPADRPVAGAEISTLRRPWGRLVGPSFPRYGNSIAGPATRSARDGTFSLRLERWEVVDLHVDRPPLAEVTLAGCPAGGKLRVVLGEGARLAVSAKDPEGRPVAGARLRLHRRPGGMESGIDRRTTTDSEGRGFFARLPPVGAVLQADHPTLGSPCAQAVNIPSAGSISVELKLPPARIISGRVTDAATGVPIPGARVGSDPFLVQAVTADAEGNFRMSFARGPTSVEDEVHAAAPGYSKVTTRIPPSGDANVDVALSLGDTVTGRLLRGPDGTPVPSAPIVIVGTNGLPGPEQQVDWIDSTSDSDGRFRIQGLNHSWTHKVVIAAPGLGCLSMEVLPANGGPGDVDLGDIRLPEARVLHGVLVDTRGGPIPGQRIALAPAERPTETPRYVHAEYRWTDDLGRFAFADLSPGLFRLESRIAGAPNIRREVVIPTDMERVEVRIEVGARETGTGSVRVEVRNAAEEPIAGASVVAVAEGAPPVQRSTGADGRAELVHIVAPKVRIHVSPPATAPMAARYLAPVPVEASADGSLVIVHLVEAALIRGRVLGPEGRPLSRMRVAAGADGNPWGNAWTDAEGSFALYLEGGVQYRVEANGNRLMEDGSGRSERTNLRCEAQEVTAPADGVTLAMHTIPVGQTLVVRVVDLEGNGIRGCSVSGPGEPKDGVYPATDADGRVTLKDLFEEESRIFASAPGGMVGKPVLPDGTVMPGPVTVIPRGQEITLRLQKGEPRTGRVLDPEGRPAANANVSLQTDDYVSNRHWSRADGTFTVWVSPGRKLIRATAATVMPDSPRLLADVQGDALPSEGEIVLRLGPWKEGR